MRQAEEKENRLLKLSELKEKEFKRKVEAENKEKTIPFESALKTINEMRRLGSTGTLGKGSGIKELWSGETRKNRAKYRHIKSFAKNVFFQYKMIFSSKFNFFIPNIP